MAKKHFTLFNSKGEKLFLKSVQEPKLTNTLGRYWKSTVKKIDEEEVTFHFSEGRESVRAFFQLDGQWYATSNKNTKGIRKLQTDRNGNVVATKKSKDKKAKKEEVAESVALIDDDTPVEQETDSVEEENKVTVTMDEIQALEEFVQLTEEVFGDVTETIRDTVPSAEVERTQFGEINVTVPTNSNLRDVVDSVRNRTVIGDVIVEM